MGRQRRSLRESGLREDEVDAPAANGSVEVLTATDEELSRLLIQVVIYMIRLHESLEAK